MQPGKSSQLVAMKKGSCDALIIGAGLAGASAAYALVRRGASVVVCEALQAVAQRASGNRFGLMMPYLSDRDSIFERLYSAGFLFSKDILTGPLASRSILRATGGVQLPTTSRLAKLLDSSTKIRAPLPILRLDAEETAHATGVPLPSRSFYVPSAGYVSPSLFVSSLLAGADVRLESRIVSLARSSMRWTACLDSGHSIDAALVIVSAAHEAACLAQLKWLPLEPVRGQTVSIKPSEISAKLKTLVCFDGYLTPAEDGSHLLGAHYRHNDPRPTPCDQDTAEILQRCQRWLPELQFPSRAVQASRVCFRTSTFDRLPYIGPIPDFAAMLAEAAAYQPGTDLSAKIGDRLADGLFATVGHGSRGLLSCPIGGEIIARIAAKEPLAELAEAAAACSPQRLVNRILMRHQEREAGEARRT